MLVLIDGPVPDSFHAHETTLREWVMTGVRAGKLDRDLAAGIRPEVSVPHALRASVLVRPRTRRDRARALTRILARADSLWPPGRSSAIPVNRLAVTAAAGEFHLIIEKLLSPGPLPVRAVAQITILINDGAGPIYLPRQGHQLHSRLQEVTHTLDLFSSP